MREKGQTEVAKTLETPVFSRGREILTEKIQLRTILDEAWGECTHDIVYKGVNKPSAKIHLIWMVFSLAGKVTITGMDT